MSGSESRTGFSVHVSIDVMSTPTREEARDKVMEAIGELPEGMAVTAVHVGKYVVSSIADTYKDKL